MRVAREKAPSSSQGALSSDGRLSGVRAPCHDHSPVRGGFNKGPFITFCQVTCLCSYLSLFFTPCSEAMKDIRRASYNVWLRWTSLLRGNVKVISKLNEFTYALEGNICVIYTYGWPNCICVDVQHFYMEIEFVSVSSTKLYGTKLKISHTLCANESFPSFDSLEESHEQHPGCTGFTFFCNTTFNKSHLRLSSF